MWGALVQNCQGFQVSISRASASGQAQSCTPAQVVSQEADPGPKTLDRCLLVGQESQLCQVPKCPVAHGQETEAVYACTLAPSSLPLATLDTQQMD